MLDMQIACVTDHIMEARDINCYPKNENSYALIYTIDPIFLKSVFTCFLVMAASLRYREHLLRVQMIGWNSMCSVRCMCYLQDNRQA